VPGSCVQTPDPVLPGTGEPAVSPSGESRSPCAVAKCSNDLFRRPPRASSYQLVVLSSFTAPFWPFCATLSQFKAPMSPAYLPYLRQLGLPSPGNPPPAFFREQSPAGCRDAARCARFYASLFSAARTCEAFRSTLLCPAHHSRDARILREAGTIRSWQEQNERRVKSQSAVAAEQLGPTRKVLCPRSFFRQGTASAVP
jgi:hypothetical protein